jgi:hypothetical protein
MTEEKKIDGRTKRALDMAIARKQVSQGSYRAVIRGEISLADAKAIGRDGAPATDAPEGRSGLETATGTPRSDSAEQDMDTPPAPKSRISKNGRSRLYLCGCQQYAAGGLFRVGHGMAMFRVAREYLEESGKMERVRARLAEEERKRQKKEGRAAERKGE